MSEPADPEPLPGMIVGERDTLFVCNECESHHHWTVRLRRDVCPVHGLVPFREHLTLIDYLESIELKRAGKTPYPCKAR